MPDLAAVATAGDQTAAGQRPLGEAVLDFVLERLWARGAHRPTCKQLAGLTAGLLAMLGM